MSSPRPPSIQISFPEISCALLPGPKTVLSSNLVVPSSPPVQPNSELWEFPRVPHTPASAPPPPPTATTSPRPMMSLYPEISTLSVRSPPILFPVQPFSEAVFPPVTVANRDQVRFSGIQQPANSVVVLIRPAEAVELKSMLERAIQMVLPFLRSSLIPELLM